MKFYNHLAIKNALFLFIFAALITACGTSRKMNRVTESSSGEILYGKINRDGLKIAPFNTWYEKQYHAYHAGPTYIEELKEYSGNISEVVIIMAAWCPDTRRELPRILRILDDMGMPESKIKMYAVDREKKNDVKGFESYKFTRVPTVIFYDGEKEIGRIIEQPEMTLEEDMVAMFRYYLKK